ncbi:hypothetical protein NGA_2115300, partial [Nannochloropsis gaditana CCMP526]|uniref:uncharacterized protein n=1 Tax=Nannochloropsis gaditana (strain CCMP526) TaxID=1093141 RepID=UPI00029F518A
QGLDVMPPEGRDVEHFPLLQHASLAISPREEGEAGQVGAQGIDAAVVAEEALAGVEAGGLGGGEKPDRLGANHLGKQVVVGVRMRGR